MKKLLSSAALALALGMGSAQAQITYTHVTGQVTYVKRGNLCRMIEMLDQVTRQYVVVATLNPEDMAFAVQAMYANKTVEVSFAASLGPDGSMYCMSCPTMHATAAGPLMSDYPIINSIQGANYPPAGTH